MHQSSRVGALLIPLSVEAGWGRVAYTTGSGIWIDAWAADIARTRRGSNLILSSQCCGCNWILKCSKFLMLDSFQALQGRR